ncbi:MAG: 3-hydroxyacyl-CoA dehydrogenase NAD-binding domain-containing protein [Hyphomicrobiaceae bacterium]
MATQVKDAPPNPVRLERDGAVAVIVIDNPPVNAGSLDVRRGLLEAIRTAAADSAIDAAVIIGAGSTFVAGSDIREFGQPLDEPQLPAVIAAIEACPKPVVAAIHGASLGGGFELALGCDARVCAPGSLVGLPEVTLGMIPGAGGTQRLPRLVGIAAAIEIVCSGRRVPAEEALRLGIVDKLIEGDLRSGAVMYARARGGRKRRLSEAPVPADTHDSVEKVASAALKAGRGRPHVAEAIDAVKSASRLPFAEALAIEREVFQRLRSGNEAAALRHLFFAEREASKVPGLADVAPRSIKRIAVVGAGTMGVGIATCFVDAGYAVTLLEQDDAGAQRGLERIREIQNRAVGSRRISAGEAQLRLARVAPTANAQELADADLVVEAVFEDMQVKIDLFRRLEPILRSDAILASNTSYLDLDQIAAATGRPGDVVGLHFFSPAHVMRLLEIVRGAQTSPDTLATALAVAKKIRKLAVVARVGEGFIGNRIYAAYRRQCEFMLEEGAYPGDIDAALTRFGFAMGPFAVSDMSGLDIAWKMRQRLAATSDTRSRYVEIADQLCQQGRFGQKTGAGWYRYSPGSRKGEPDPEVRKLIDAASSAKGITRQPFTAEEIYRRALVTMVNEAALLLEEGIAARPSDVDLVMVNGYGFPNYEGGPLFWASREDRRRLLADLDRLVEASGHGFRKGDVAAVLDRMR